MYNVILLKIGLSYNLIPRHMSYLIPSSYGSRLSSADWSPLHVAKFSEAAIARTQEPECHFVRIEGEALKFALNRCARLADTGHDNNPGTSVSWYRVQCTRGMVCPVYLLLLKFNAFHHVKKDKTSKITLLRKYRLTHLQ